MDEKPELFYFVLLEQFPVQAQEKPITVVSLKWQVVFLTLGLHADLFRLFFVFMVLVHFDASDFHFIDAAVLLDALEQVQLVLVLHSERQVASAVPHLQNVSALLMITEDNAPLHHIPVPFSLLLLPHLGWLSLVYS